MSVCMYVPPTQLSLSEGARLENFAWTSRYHYNARARARALSLCIAPLTATPLAEKERERERDRQTDRQKDIPGQGDVVVPPGQ